MVFELLEILSKYASMLTYKSKCTSKISLNVYKRLIKVNNFQNFKIIDTRVLNIII